MVDFSQPKRNGTTRRPAETNNVRPHGRIPRDRRRSTVRAAATATRPVASGMASPRVRAPTCSMSDPGQQATVDGDTRIFPETCTNGCSIGAAPTSPLAWIAQTWSSRPSCIHVSFAVELSQTCPLPCEQVPGLGMPPAIRTSSLESPAPARHRLKVLELRSLLHRRARALENTPGSRHLFRSMPSSNDTTSFCQIYL